jgi:hypothetical protein
MTARLNLIRHSCYAKAQRMAHNIHSRTTRHIAHVVMMLLVLVAMPVGVEAGFVKFWQLKETAAAPVLVVGRVLSVQKGERVPEESLPWKTETLSMTAEIQVLRSYPASGESVAADRLHVHF